jgi:lactate dehydrogenase-like 2-hydroxyacid dehydrogenase
MTSSETAAHADKPPVIFVHALPDWSVAELPNAYDLQPFDPASSACREARVAITTGPQRLDGEILDQLPKLEYLIAVGSGCEGIDLAYVHRRGVMVSNSAPATAEDVADHAVALILTLHGGIIPLDHAVRSDHWRIPVRRSLREMKVGIVGLGAIGAAVARLLSAFGCEVRWTGPHAKDSPYAYVADLAELADWSDIFVVAARADDSNRGMINAEIIEKVGPAGLLANISRGSIIDEDALLDALRTGRLGGAALDVFQTEPTPGARWRDLANVVVTPHVGGHTTGARRGIGRLIRQNLDAFFSGKRPVGVLEPRVEQTR